MLYYLFRYLHEHFHLPGAGVFQYTTFRAALSVIVSLLIAQFFGARLIRVLQRKQLGETIRDLGLHRQSCTSIFPRRKDPTTRFSLRC